MQAAHLGSLRTFWHHMGMGHLRPPRRLAPADLKGAALDYLDRFAAPRARLRQVMLRKIRNSVRVHGDDPAPLIAALDETIQWLETSGFLSDRAYAEARARSLSARGTSRAHILAKLSAKGVESETARAAVDRLSTEYEEPELEAARRYARRRRLGPYRSADDMRAECRDKDLAAMARAGFAGRVARQIIDAEREA
ncbi:MAG TPA: RecX family transcriptional regulator [Dongiaceae bacterium]|nr:RecX family transcriptional regulator [Dongiaceae bacterium]